VFFGFMKYSLLFLITIIVSHLESYAQVNCDIGLVSSNISERPPTTFDLVIEVDTDISGLNRESLHLRDNEIGGMIYNPQKMDPGFFEEKKINVSLKNTQIIFENIPVELIDHNFMLIILRKDCSVISIDIE
jgi:hypothetical protein